MEDSEYESTDSGLDVRKKRAFPIPTPKGAFMFVGVAMIIALLGMAGYIFYKGPDSKSHRLVASTASSAAPKARRNEEISAPPEDHLPPEPANPAPPAVKRPKKKRSAASQPPKKKSKATKKTAKGIRKRRTTTDRAFQDAPREAAEEQDAEKVEKEEEQGSGGSDALRQDSEPDDSEEEDNKNARRLFKEDPRCTSRQELFECSYDQQADMMRSYVCMKSSTSASCIEWRPQRLCLSSEENRFGSAEECKKACEGQNAGKCGKATLCECTRLYRKVNYIFDVRRQRCRLVPLHECIEKEVGFPSEDSCKAACVDDDKDERCKLAALEDLVRPCLWNDKQYTHFYDHKKGRCKGFDEGVCASNAFIRLTQCLGGCKDTPDAAVEEQRLLHSNVTLHASPTPLPPKLGASPTPSKLSTAARKAA